VTRLSYMRLELGHLFVCTAPGAPEAEEFIRFGLREGPPNQHPGQGTANRRFAFANAMIELLWVSDAQEAQSERARKLYSGRGGLAEKGKASPFGICVRPVDPQNTGSPLPAREYRPSYLPDPLVMDIGEAEVEEPMWVYLRFMRQVDRECQFVEHPIGVREITSLALATPVSVRSTVAQRMIECGILSVKNGPKSLLEIGFDGSRRKQIYGFQAALAARLPTVIGRSVISTNDASRRCRRIKGLCPRS
jgi:hypothetical protein